MADWRPANHLSRLTWSSVVVRAARQLRPAPTPSRWKPEACLFSHPSADQRRRFTLQKLLYQTLLTFAAALSAVTP